MSARLSEGLSLKSPGYQDYSVNSASMSKQIYYGTNVENDDANDCCIGTCEKKKSCSSYAMCGCFKRRDDCVFCGVFTLMLFALFIGVIGPLAMNALIDSEINSELIIDSPNAPSFNVWQTNAEGEGTKTKIFFDLYFFDFQNAMETLRGAKPVVVEKGPYAYDEYFYKFDIEWSEDGDLITFNNRRYFMFNAERTGANLTENDVLTLPYATVMGFQYLLGKIPVNATVAIELIMENKTTVYYEGLLDNLDETRAEIKASDMSASDKAKQLAAVNKIEANLDSAYATLIKFMQMSDPSLLLTKLILSMSPYGVSPYFQSTPGRAYFGWLNDPVLLIVQQILNMLELKTGKHVKWTSAVSGAVTNYTSVEEARRRKTRDTLRTGKKNIKQVMQYVKFYNSTQVWSCVAPTASQDENEYVEGEQFPACKHFQENWNESYAEKMGYQQPYATAYANRVEGSNAELYGRPVTTEFVQIFIGDIYRSAYAIKTAEMNDLYGLKLFRYQLQEKDLWNATKNPANAQYYNYAPNGMGNLTGAVNAPVWISNPHFTDCDQNLIDSIEGIYPNASTHRTFLDIEPQTGQLVRGKKALQENWRVTTMKFPTISPSVFADLNNSCLAFQTLLIQLSQSDAKDFNISKIPDCNLTIAEAVLGILSTPTDWVFSQDVMFLPLAYCEEYNEITEADAHELTTSLYDTETFITDLQNYCFLVAAICFLYLIFHVYYFRVQAVPRSVSMCDDVDVASKLLAEKDAMNNSSHTADTNATFDASKPLLANSFNASVGNPIHEEVM